MDNIITQTPAESNVHLYAAKHIADEDDLSKSSFPHCNAISLEILIATSSFFTFVDFAV